MTTAWREQLLASLPRAIRWGLDVLLLTSAVGVVLTGAIVDRLDLHGFVLHRRFGYAMAVLALIHVVLHHRALRPPCRRGRHGGAESPARIETDSWGPDPLPAEEVGEAASAHSAVATPPRWSRRTALASGVAGFAGAGLGWLVRGAAEPAAYGGGDVGIFYHRESSLGLTKLLGDVLDWGRAPPRYKTGGGDPLPLPPVGSWPEMTVAQAVQQRRSHRRYADRALRTEELAWVVGAATGITAADERRTAPSAGALYPIETYVAAIRVDGIPAGLYHVDVRAQALELVRRGSVSGDLLLASVGQEFLGQAPAVLVLTGLFQRTRWKYHARHYRYVCWEAGHIAQNIYLAAEAANLGACVVGTFLDGMLNDLLDVDGKTEAALGLIALGPV